jgi:misacylated tRNA(Ala) deacylase
MTSERRYLDDPYCRVCDAVVTETADGASALSQTIFHPGGGGQPHDRGTLVSDGETLAVTALREDEHGRIWHAIGRSLARGAPVQLVLDWPFRFALMRYHALMHLVNTIAWRDFGARMTGAQLGAERSRIDLEASSLGRDRLGELEAKVNEVIDRDHAIVGAVISEREYARRPDLVRTRDVAPPVVDGRVRVVEIVGFDAQACGGTHVHTTREIGRARIARFDNKGKDNKRLYWTLDP